MNEALSALAKLLSDVILPNLKSVQMSQAEQIEANSRLEKAIEELRMHLDAQFATLSAQLTSCRAELAATQAILKATQAKEGVQVPERPALVH